MLRAYGADGRSTLDDRENARPYLSSLPRQPSLPRPGAPRASSFGPAARRGRRHGMSATRRLAAILAADVAGYSRLIGADEEGTLNRLRSIRAELIDPKTFSKCDVQRSRPKDQQLGARLGNELGGPPQIRLRILA